MSKINDGEPAFPATFIVEAGSNDPFTNKKLPPEEELRYMFKGMSLRDYFAGQALIGLLASDDGQEVCRSTTAEGIEQECREYAIGKAKSCYRYADAMLAARKIGGAA